MSYPDAPETYAPEPSPGVRLEAQPAEIETLKGIFLASLNHEIRTPLSGILGMTDLLLETSLDDEQKDYVQAARLCAEQLFEILNATLEYSALEAGHFLLDDAEFSLKELLASCMQQYATQASAKGLRLTSILDPTLPETLVGDAPRLRQLIGHLLGNAVKFTKAGSVELRARRDSDGRDHLVIEVADTGIGIEHEKMGAIFESFRQGESGLSRTYSGLGLGLALVKKLALLMDGHVTAVSEAGHGSTFTLRLPMRRPVDPLTDAQATPEKKAGPSILAVEDNPVGMMVLRRALDRHGEIVYATSGPEAIDAAAHRKFDLVLMDLQMPDMDGLETTAVMRTIPGYHDVPILALTANASDELREQCRQAGMQAFLSKPVDATSLWSAVSKFL